MSLNDLSLDDLLPERDDAAVVRPVRSYTPPQQGGKRLQAAWDVFKDILPLIKSRDVFFSLLTVVGFLVVINGLQTGWLKLPRRQAGPVEATVFQPPIPVVIPATPLPPVVEPVRVIEVTRIVEVTRVIPASQAPGVARPQPEVRNAVVEAPPQMDRFFCYVDPNGISGSQPLRVERGLFTQLDVKGSSPNMEITATNGYGEKRTWKKCRPQ